MEKENNWEEKYKKEHKLRQEAEGELSIIKTTSVTNSPEMREANSQIKDLQNSLDRFKKENNECYNRIAELTDSLNSKDYFKDPDYKYLIEQNRKLEEERNELRIDNKKLTQQIDDQIKKLRESGLL
jgi:uncharacterized membrane-anchored protein YhcB (DUF1043 family)